MILQKKHFFLNYKRIFRFFDIFFVNYKKHFSDFDFVNYYKTYTKLYFRFCFLGIIKQTQQTDEILFEGDVFCFYLLSSVVVSVFVLDKTARRRRRKIAFFVAFHGNY